MLRDYTPFYLVMIVFLSATIAIVYPLLIDYSRRITPLIFGRISAESLYGLFIGNVFLLAYHDSGISTIFGVLMAGLVSGMLSRVVMSISLLFMVLVVALITISLL